MAANESDNIYLNTEKLEAYRTETTVAGVYLNAWNIFSNYVKNNNINIKLHSYLITFSENDSEYLIYFTKPRIKKTLGGGNGVCRISKTSHQVIEFKLAK